MSKDNHLIQFQSYSIIMKKTVSRIQKIKQRFGCNPQPSIKFRNVLYMPYQSPRSAFTSAQKIDKKDSAPLPVRQPLASNSLKSLSQNILNKAFKNILQRPDPLNRKSVPACIQTAQQNTIPKSRKQSIADQLQRFWKMNHQKQLFDNDNETISIIPKQKDSMIQQFLPSQVRCTIMPLGQIDQNRCQMQNAQPKRAKGSQSQLFRKIEMSKRVQVLQKLSQPSSQLMSIMKNHQHSQIQEILIDLSQIKVKDSHQILIELQTPQKNDVIRIQDIIAKPIRIPIPSVKQPTIHQSVNPQTLRQAEQIFSLISSDQDEFLDISNLDTSKLDPLLRFRLGPLICQAAISGIYKDQFIKKTAKVLDIKLEFPNHLKLKVVEQNYNNLKTGQQKWDELSDSSIRQAQQKLNQLDSKLDSYIKLHMSSQRVDIRSMFCFKELNNWL